MRSMCGESRDLWLDQATPHPLPVTMARSPCADRLLSDGLPVCREHGFRNEALRSQKWTSRHA